MEQSRRRAPRIQVLGQIRGQLVPRAELLVIRDVSTGGFGVESTLRFSVGAHHRFVFTSDDGLEIVLDAEVRYCRPSSRDRRLLVSGFAFVSKLDETTQQSIDHLLDAALAAVASR